MLEKKVKFNNKYWLVRKMNPYFFEVYKCKEDGSINMDFRWEGVCDNGCRNIIEEIQNVILKANNYYDGFHEIELLSKWDGDMDKVANGILTL